MENILVIISIIGGMFGIAGFVLSMIVIIRQTKRQAINVQEREIQKQEQARNDRLMFLAKRIFNSSMPSELRQPFYDEYISILRNAMNC